MKTKLKHPSHVGRARPSPCPHCNHPNSHRSTFKWGPPMDRPMSSLRWEITLHHPRYGPSHRHAEARCHLPMPTRFYPNRLRQSGSNTAPSILTATPAHRQRPSRTPHDNSASLSTPSASQRGGHERPNPPKGQKRVTNKHRPIGSISSRTLPRPIHTPGQKQSDGKCT